MKKASDLKLMRRQLEKLNSKRPKRLVMVPEDKWPEKGKLPNMIELWISNKYLVQVFEEKDDLVRVSVNRTSMNQAGEWEENLTWDELMQVKREIGRGDRYAVEVLPEDLQIVNVANMRHFWILQFPVCGWRD